MSFDDEGSALMPNSWMGGKYMLSETIISILIYLLQVEVQVH